MHELIPQVDICDWEEVYTCPILPDDEYLIEITDNFHPKIFVKPYYYEQDIKHALPRCYVRKSVAEKLILAAEKLPDDINLMLLDGWRPLELQQELVRLFAQEIKLKFSHKSSEEQKNILDQFVAKPSLDPECPSPHFTGGSIDLTLCDAKGRSLDMGTLFDEPVIQSWTHRMEVESQSSQACRNRRLLYWAMISAGFTNLPSEWWHYDYGNQLWCYFGNHQHAFYSSTSL
ncbi:M15 family metallopeptidase [Acinetobacter sp. ACZLY 512]|uniref:M15 family metallopeptidase n=1 Tax=Acinetobacter sp. ACZLY 512 TaxID=2911206 RepID=UPI002026D878|nr:M15 family metallopeptidase [uncultured Acinetobacter sp.]MCL9675083.1 M15 family metallopeptidase [Acinetobacter sp. ACZLY 512]